MSTRNELIRAISTAIDRSRPQIIEGNQSLTIIQERQVVRILLSQNSPTDRNTAV